MPRIDPMTGCSVMTMGEFLSAEAEREGCDPSDIMENIYSTMDAENKRDEARLHDPREALECFESWQKDFEDDPEFANPKIIHVMRVISAVSHSSFGGSGEKIVAEVQCEDGNQYLADYWYSYSNGSRWEPPDADGELNLSPIPELRSMRQGSSKHTCACGSTFGVHKSRSKWSNKAAYRCQECRRAFGPVRSWETLCKRTNDPKLRYIENRLDLLGIAHKRQGESAHAPILKVDARCIGEAWEMLGEKIGRRVFDDIPDDDKMFRAYR